MTTADENASGSPSANPIPIPSAGNVNSSFWQNITLQALTLPSTQINNVKFYTGGSNPFGTGVLFSGSHTGSYKQAIGTVGTTGINMAASWWNPNQMSNLFNFTSASPLTLTGSILSTGVIGSFTEWVTYQVYVLSTAGAGQTS